VLVITIDVEKEKWKSVDIRDRNSKGADIDIHEYCLALHCITRQKVEIGKCWFCHNSIQMCGGDWECVNLNVPGSTDAGSVYVCIQTS